MNKSTMLSGILFACLCLAPAGAITNEASVARGKVLFEKATCASCHPSGQNLLHPSRVLVGPTFTQRYKYDQDIVKIVRSGVPNTGMPSFGKAQLSDSELKDIIAYIRSLTPSATCPKDSSSKAPMRNNRSLRRPSGLPMHNL